MFSVDALLLQQRRRLVTPISLPISTSSSTTSSLTMMSSDDTDNHTSDRELSKRQRLRLGFQRHILSEVGFSSGLRRRHSHHHHRRNRSVDKTATVSWKNSKALCAWGKKDEPSEEKDNNKKTDGMWDKFTTSMEEWKEDVSQKILSVLPAPSVELLTNILTKIQEWMPNLKLAVLSFVTGGVVMLSAILVPVYSSVENLSEPVTLFETILADLDAGYVDPVDTNKLFETGVSAMLRSLDPYTEYESSNDAQILNEGIMGKYGGVGLVIAGVTPKDVAEMQKLTTAPPTTTIQQPTAPDASQLLPQDAIEDSMTPLEGANDAKSSTQTKKGVPKARFISTDNDELDLDDEEDEEERLVMEKQQRQVKAIAKAQEKGIRVVSAFEGYAFDYGMRVGDRLKQVDDLMVTTETSVEDVRNVLRGEPGTMVTIKFERDGVPGIQQVTMPRTVVQLRDVKLATLVGKPSDGIGYISLSGFAASAGAEVRGAILALEQAAEDASNGAHSLKGLILDLRGNPGGLLTSAVDVASLLVPNGSDIVSAKGRGFPGVIYRSRVEPLLDPSTKLAVLVNRGTASAAEIVSGAVQDLDVGVIIGTDRTFGKGLVQNVESLPFDSALKFTVAKYYTPSGRCIQGVQYKEGGGLREEDGKYQASRVAKKDRQVFYTKGGRMVRDGGGIEADYKVPAPKASALEVTLLRSDIMNEFASHWSQKYELTNNFEVTDDVYREFQDFVEAKRQAGDIKLEGLYSGALEDLKRALKQSGYKGSEREVEQLTSHIVKDIKSDFEKYKKDIKEDIATSILARYLPESLIMERGLKTDTQVQEAVKLLSNNKSFEKILARGSTNERVQANVADSSSVTVSSLELEDQQRDGASLSVDF
ncbi:carboxyl-terminal protease [Nitzschia inconspicua]|uniref:Carboxyl-terminal protease n=1 Tax=Nitzschia inconspicua TaxID=303405 RepID=A0A9K3PNR9_9STRA|nr:carboxyl-terminal protease [Nitzschia inconspicua]